MTWPRRTILAKRWMTCRAKSKRVFTFFGMIPNLEPDVILPKLRRCFVMVTNFCSARTWLPARTIGPGWSASCHSTTTRATGCCLFEGDWCPETAGELVFGIEPVDELLRIVANFKFSQSQAIKLDGELVAFDVGQTLRLFSSSQGGYLGRAWPSTTCRSCLAISPSPGRSFRVALSD